MQTLFIVIKGDQHTAEQETKRRGIEYTYEASSANGQESYGYADIRDLPKVIEWYCEDRGLASIAEFGECLWYAERK